jgi:hypothetical protein
MGLGFNSSPRGESGCESHESLVFAGFAASRLRTAIAALAAPPLCRSSRRMICAIGVSRSCISPGSRGRASARRRDSRSPAVTADTYTHLLADERELDYAGLLAD